MKPDKELGAQEANFNNTEQGQLPPIYFPELESFNNYMLPMSLQAVPTHNMPHFDNNHEIRYNPINITRQADRANNKLPNLRRRERIVFNTAQLGILERAFETTKYPDVVQRTQLSTLIGVDETRVGVWFKNRRAKERNHLRQLGFTNIRFDKYTFYNRADDQNTTANAEQSLEEASEEIQRLFPSSNYDDFYEHI